ARARSDIADAGGCVLDTSNHRAGQQQDAPDVMSDVYPWLRIMTSALRYLRRPQAECEARKIAPRRASIYT
ncbi:hypothetical protein, partial [Pseudomonas aeruginosa]|uniref:hypothetical protein n=1 Tax=Pseudomonas aeruginosa TaxID=287 RepID=UPI0021E89DB9